MGPRQTILQGQLTSLVAHLRPESWPSLASLGGSCSRPLYSQNPSSGKIHLKIWLIWCILCWESKARHILKFTFQRNILVGLMMLCLWKELQSFVWITKMRSLKKEELMMILRILMNPVQAHVLVLMKISEPSLGELVSCWCQWCSDSKTLWVIVRSEVGMIRLLYSFIHVP